MTDDFKDQVIDSLVDALKSYDEWVVADDYDWRKPRFKCSCCEMEWSEGWLLSYPDDPCNHFPDCKRVKALRMVELLKRRQSLEKAMAESEERSDRIIEGKKE